MSDQSSTISVDAASELIGLALAGAMTEATYTELRQALTVSSSSSNAKTTSESTSPDGSTNSTPRSATPDPASAPSSTRSEEPSTGLSNTPLSHYGCWCNSYRKRDTSDA